MLLFLALTAWVVYCGVEKGIEKYSRYIMPGLLLLIIGISVFALTLSHTDENGVTRTGLQGLAVYLKPDFTGMTVSPLPERGAGRHEPAVLLPQRQHGHHDHLRQLRQGRCGSEQGQQPD